MFESIKNKFQFKFKDRTFATDILAAALEDFLKSEKETKNDRLVVLGIPRGGVIVADIDLQRYMISDIDSNLVLTRKEREELVLDLYFNQNKTYHEIAKIAKISSMPEVDSQRISVIGHSEGTLYAPRIAIDNPTKVKNIVLMATLAQNASVSEYNLDVSLPSEYATKVLDKNNTGLISIQQIANAPVLRNSFVPSSVLITNNTKEITNTLAKAFGTSGDISIDRQLKPALVKIYQNTTILAVTILGRPACLLAHKPAIRSTCFNITPPNTLPFGLASEGSIIIVISGLESFGCLPAFECCCAAIETLSS